MHDERNQEILIILVDVNRILYKGIKYFFFLMALASSWMLAALETDGEMTRELTGEGIKDVLQGVTSFHFTFISALVCLSLLIIVSIVFDKLGAKLGIPGSIFLFFCGLFFHVSGYNFELFPLEEIHVVALSILLFFSGLSFDGTLLRKNKVLPNSILLALLGTFLSMMFWLAYLGFGYSFFQNTFGYLEGVKPSILWLIAVSSVFSLAVQDWNSFVFVSKRIKDFRTVVSNIFKVETAVSAAISVAVAEILVLAWISLNPGYSPIANSELVISIFKGFLIGSLSGLILGILLTYLIRYLLTSKAQLILAAVAFTFIGYSISVFAVHQGGYLCALIMGIVTSLSYRSCSREDEIEFLSEELESLNIACEAILFFAIGLGLQPVQFFSHLPIAIYTWIGIILVRPITVSLFFRGPSMASQEKKLLANWSPKGAISMALIVTTPLLLDDTFGIEVARILPENSITFMSDVVCGAVLISLVFKALMIPRLHEKLFSSLNSSENIS